jgi:predicted dehydrogenase
MYAEGSRYQEEITAVGPAGKIEAKVPGPTRFWQDPQSPPPSPIVVLSPRDPVGPREMGIEVDPELLEAGDHNGATFYQHVEFLKVVRGERDPEITCFDGAMAVKMGLAAQKSAETRQAVLLDEHANQ